VLAELGQAPSQPIKEEIKVETAKADDQPILAATTDVPVKPVKVAEPKAPAKKTKEA
jgi:hypothetical protein